MKKDFDDVQSLPLAWYTGPMNHNDTIKEVVSSIIFAALMGFMVVVLFSIPREIFY